MTSPLLVTDNSVEGINRALIDLAGKTGTSSGVPSGVIEMYGGSTAPDGYLLCDGSSYAVGSYPDLFKAIGFAYGGSGSAFNVPNFQGLSPVMPGSQSVGGRTKTGPSLGASREDQFQGHWHTEKFGDQADSATGYRASYIGATNLTKAAVGALTKTDNITTPVTDTVNGTPRTGAYTHGPELGVNFIIKT